MKKTIFFLLAAVFCLPMSAETAKEKKANKDTQAFRYEIECAGNAQPGSYLVTVWSYSKKASVAENQCRKNAVHGVLFKGFSGGNGCIAQRAIVNIPGAEDANKVYFDTFFGEGGEFMKYASIVGGTAEVVKVGKEYKVGQVVNVRKDELRKAMESAGIIKSFNAGF
ncbi:MAG: hypothetical protein MJZ75_00045 [Paludibacteraceae bacterium]|nr:hypothetical protein [Paludibacteraceae bacterium]